MKQQIIFGPVNSRRFGLSLGVDLSPQTKQCNFDCLYCELAPKRAISEFSEILSVDEILSAIKNALKKEQNLQKLTITANGEPTLYPHLYELALKLIDIKNAAYAQNPLLQSLLLTNGSLLGNPSVKASAMLFDCVKISLDSADYKIYSKIDRPHKSLNFEQIYKGIAEFARDFSGEIFIEILFLELNSKDEQVEKLAHALKYLRYNRLDIGTIDRPPAYRVSPISNSRLFEIAKIFEKFGISANVALRANNKDSIDIESSIESKAQNTPKLNLNKEQILKTLALRAQSTADVAQLWSKESIEILQNLLKENQIKIRTENGINFYENTAKSH